MVGEVTFRELRMLWNRLSHLELTNYQISITQSAVAAFCQMCLSLDGQEHFRMPSAQKASTLPFFMKRLMPACIVDAQSIANGGKRKALHLKRSSRAHFSNKHRSSEPAEISHYFCLCTQSQIKNRREKTVIRSSMMGARPSNVVGKLEA